MPGGENKTATFLDLDRMGGMPSASERPSARPSGPGDPVANEAMDRYADGDASAFPVLYNAIAPRIEGLVRRRTRDASRIDDIVQQTFERIHRARGTFIRGSDVLSWAFKIARNLCVDFVVELDEPDDVPGDALRQSHQVVGGPLLERDAPRQVQQRRVDEGGRDAHRTSVPVSSARRGRRWLVTQERERRNSTYVSDMT